VAIRIAVMPWFLPFQLFVITSLPVPISQYHNNFCISELYGTCIWSSRFKWCSCCSVVQHCSYLIWGTLFHWFSQCMLNINVLCIVSILILLTVLSEGFLTVISPNRSTIISLFTKVTNWPLHCDCVKCYFTLFNI
jgi:hypothetical protein